jgi:glycosyltransferase involved in cell wall biosynthesis
LNNSASPFVSVIVPTYNDIDRLKVCLQALEEQTYRADCYEIIVVDNASKNSWEIEATVKNCDRAVYTYESRPGSYAARNQGISLAKGEILAFTDADCIPHRDWLERGVETLLKTPNCGLVAGKIELFFQDSDRPTAIELFENVTAFPQAQLLDVSKGGATANIFTFKKVFERVGNFNSALKSNGDLEWGRRVFESGYQQVYAEDVCVAHPARSDWNQLYKRTIRLAGGIYDRGERAFIREIIFHLTPPLRFVVNAARNPHLKNWQQKLQAIAVMFFTRYITAWELCRLKMGGISARE